MASGKPPQALAAPVLWLHRRLLPRDAYAGWAAYLWLVWLGFIFVSPWVARAPGTRTIVATVAAVALFLPLYFRYYWAGNAERIGIIAAVAAIGCALIPLNGSGGGFLIYAGAFAGYRFGPRRAMIALAVLAALPAVEYAALGYPFVEWLWVPVITLIVGAANLWAAERQRQHCVLKRSQEEVRRLAAVAERERIGRDLHDLLGHTLTLITVKAELAAKLAEHDLAGAAREIREVERVSRGALQQVREAVGAYRKGGLAGELANARVALSAANVQLSEEVEAPPLSRAQESLLAMLLREAVTNVVRHSGARHCRIELAGRGRDVHLLVEDDGHGGALREGNGLGGMRDRLLDVSGRLDIASGEKGTRLSIVVPVEDRRSGDGGPALTRQPA